MSDSTAIAVGLDLGSTAIKAGVLDSGERLRDVRSIPAPALRGSGPIREGDACAYASAVHGLVREMAKTVPRGTPLGMATQRSSFTVWDRRDARPQQPLISWQDRRAADWCDRHRAIEPEIVRRTGLLLSAHYVGPKLAALQERDEEYARALRAEHGALGTLETLLVYRWSAGRRHETDVTVAARTLMLDLARNAWSPELLGHFGVPERVLPTVVPTTRARLPLECGLALAATLSDQASAALAVFDPRRDTALVNLGTGAFVLRPAERADLRIPGYLLAPIFGAADGSCRYALEGTVNGAGPAVDACGPGPTELPESDPSPESFAVPDRSGLGSPYWRPEIGLTLSPAAERLSQEGQRRVVLEGVLFRVRQILDDLSVDSRPERIVAGGGLTRDPAVGPALAALLERPVDLLLERESGLLGASRLAAGLPPYAHSPTRTVPPGPHGRYLPKKYPAWKNWLATLLP
jgi:glycerol kinase